MAKTKTVRKLEIRLDRLVSLESNLLDRYALLPVARRQEWLRGLLMQGFRDECRVLSGVPESQRHRPMMTFSRRIGRKSPSPVVTREPVSMAGVAQVTTTPAAGKPFAALGKVIG